jgi:hypothetical protein
VIKGRHLRKISSGAAFTPDQSVFNRKGSAATQDKIRLMSGSGLSQMSQHQKSTQFQKQAYMFKRFNC